MSENGLRLSLGAILLAILLSIPEVPGSIIGVFFGFGIAFFVAGPCWLVTSALNSFGLPATFMGVMVGLVVLYATMVAAIGLFAWRTWMRGNVSAGRLLTAKAALFAALPLMGYLSTNAMANAWHA